MRSVPLALLLGVGAIGATAAQAGVGDRLAGRVAPDVAAVVRQLAESAAARGLPVEALVEKAIEGGAKGVPGDRIVRAVRVVVARLDAAGGALRAAGWPTPAPEAIEAGAFAIDGGLTSQEVETLAHKSHAPYSPAATLRVAGTLAALGVPGETAVSILKAAIDAGRSPAELVDLPRQVQTGMANGASAAEAAGGSNPGPGRAPGQSGQAPGQSGQAPGQSGQAPGQSGQSHGPPSTNPGHSRKP